MQPVNGINSVTTVMKSAGNIDTEMNDVISLDDRLIAALSQFTAASEMNKASVLRDIDNTVNMTPEYLIQVQDKVLNYNVEVSLASAVARKAVGAVESLLRS